MLRPLVFPRGDMKEVKRGSVNLGGRKHVIITKGEECEVLHHYGKAMTRVPRFLSSLSLGLTLEERS